MSNGGAHGVRTGPTCGAARKGGKGPCGNPAGYQTDHPGWGTCKFHLGNAKANRTAAHRERVAHEVARWQERNAFPVDSDVVLEGPETMLRQLARAEATVAFIRGRMALWDLPVSSRHGRDGAATLDGRHEEREYGTDTGLYGLLQFRETESGGAYGPSERRAWLEVLSWWEAHAAKLSTKVTQLGIQARHQAWLEAMSGNLDLVLRTAVRRLGLDADDMGVRTAVAAAIREEFGGQGAPVAVLPGVGQVA